jgi:hypothetical protein
VTREDAVAECERLARDHPDRDLAAWVPREEESGDWVVVRIPRPGRALSRDELRTGQSDAVRPDPAQDVAQEPNRYWGGA